MFGDGSETFLEKFEELLETYSLEDLLEQEDLNPAEALYLLFISGHVKSPFDR